MPASLYVALSRRHGVTQDRDLARCMLEQLAKDHGRNPCFIQGELALWQHGIQFFNGAPISVSLLQGAFSRQQGVHRCNHQVRCAPKNRGGPEFEVAQPAVIVVPIDRDVFENRVVAARLSANLPPPLQKDQVRCQRSEHGRVEVARCGPPLQHTLGCRRVVAPAGEPFEQTSVPSAMPD